MRIVLILACCMALSACGSARTSPEDLATVRQVLEATLNQLNEGIEREDPMLASQLISDLFVMNPNIALRYLDAPWDGQGRVTFRDFFTKVFENHANIYHQLELTDLELSGEIAIVRVDVEFNSTRIDRSPPESYLAQAEDLFVFQREGGQWLLIDWTEADNQPDHDQGNLDDL